MPVNRLTQYLNQSSVDRLLNFGGVDHLQPKKTREATRRATANLLQPIPNITATEVLRYLDDMGLMRKIKKEFYLKTSKKVELNEPMIETIRNIHEIDNKSATKLRNVFFEQLTKAYEEESLKGSSVNLETIKAIVEYLNFDDFEFNEEAHIANHNFTKKHLDKYLSN